MFDIFVDFLTADIKLRDLKLKVHVNTQKNRNVQVVKFRLI
jgi:hypothetical protein